MSMDKTESEDERTAEEMQVEATRKTTLRKNHRGERLNKRPYSLGLAVLFLPMLAFDAGLNAAMVQVHWRYHTETTCQRGTINFYMLADAAACPEDNWFKTHDEHALFGLGVNASDVSSTAKYGVPGVPHMLLAVDVFTAVAVFAMINGNWFRFIVTAVIIVPKSLLQYNFNTAMAQARLTLEDSQAQDARAVRQSDLSGYWSHMLAAYSAIAVLAVLCGAAVRIVIAPHRLTLGRYGRMPYFTCIDRIMYREKSRRALCGVLLNALEIAACVAVYTAAAHTGVQAALVADTYVRYALEAACHSDTISNYRSGINVTRAEAAAGAPYIPECGFARWSTGDWFFSLWETDNLEDAYPGVVFALGYIALSATYVLVAVRSSGPYDLLFTVAYIKATELMRSFNADMAEARLRLTDDVFGKYESQYTEQPDEAGQRAHTFANLLVPYVIAATWYKLAVDLCYYALANDYECDVSSRVYRKAKRHSAKSGGEGGDGAPPAKGNEVAEAQRPPSDSDDKKNK